MSNKFKSQVVVVTGGSSGIGLAIARSAIAEGARHVVYVTGRSEQKLDDARKSLGEQAVALISDTCRADDLAALRREWRI